MDYLIQIYRDGVWRDLVLFEETRAPYNVISNKIGEPGTREISHSNTFKIPRVRQNLDTFDLSEFNIDLLSKALNSKYPCKITTRGSLIVEGFAVINNQDDEYISLNVIDNALELLDKWGATTLSELLNDSALVANLPADYQAAITEMQGYTFQNLTVQPLLSDVGTRGFPISAFPNNMNAIGDKYNNDKNGDRVPTDNCNPYQSRPLYNNKALFDIMCLAYGYDPVYDDSIDKDELEDNYIVPSKKGDNQNPSALEKSQTYSRTNELAYWQLSSGGSKRGEAVFNMDSSIALRPNDISGWVAPSEIEGTGYENKYCVYQPRLDSGSYGTVQFQFTRSTGWLASFNSRVLVKSVWDRAGAIIFADMTQTPDYSPYTFTDRDVSFTVDKTELDTPPVVGDVLVGIMVIIQTKDYSPFESFSLSQLNLTDIYLDTSQVVYDEFNQYYYSTPNLTLEAPVENLKELVSYLLTQKGILLYINSKTSEATFYTYAAFKRKSDAGQFSDWSQYFIENRGVSYNTDFGNKFAEYNKISLNTPYKGNTNTIRLQNYSDQSKYKISTDAPAKGLKDISGVLFVNSGGTYPYFEYKNEGLGLVYSNDSIAGLTQIHLGTPDTTLPNLAVKKVQNVNYGVLPTGIRDYYNIVDTAVRCQAWFSLPESVIRNIDVTEPIYVEGLRGFCIVEEVPSYDNSQTPIKVKLIKY